MSQVPPPFNPTTARPAPAARGGGSKIWLWILLLVFLMCVIGGIGVYLMGKTVVGMAQETAQCAMTYEVAQNAVIAYAKDHNGKLPEAATWQDDVRPYYARLESKVSSEMAKAPDFVKGFVPAKAAGDWSCNTKGLVTGMMFNKDVSGKEISTISAPSATVLIFEVPENGTNLNGTYKTQDPAKAPKIMNEHRDWFVLMLEHNSKATKSSSGTIDLEIKPEDALPGASNGAESKTSGQ